MYCPSLSLTLYILPPLITHPLVPYATPLLLQLINEGANLDAKTRIEHTPLHLACRYGHYNIALALLVKGAEVDSRDNEFNTPLHKAARFVFLWVGRGRMMG